jgi:hypothetical protein
LFLSVAIIGVALVTFWINHQPKTANNGPGSQFLANELMVQFRQGMVPTESNAAVGGYVQTGLSSIDALNAKYHIDSIEPAIQNPSEYFRKYGFDRLYLFKSTRDFDVQEAVEEYSTDPNVEYAEPNYITTID